MKYGKLFHISLPTLDHLNLTGSVFSIKMYKYDELISTKKESFTLNRISQQDNKKQTSEIIFQNNNNNFTEENQEKKTNLFTIKLLHKRGRKACSEENKIMTLKTMETLGNKNRKRRRERKHGKNSFDNVQRKVQIHYINFLINLCNDILKSIYGQDTTKRFLDIEHKIKQKVSAEYFNHLKNLTLLEILSLNVSNKYAVRKNTDNNIKIIKELVNTEPKIKYFFLAKHLDLFRKYYINEGKKLTEFEYNGIKISISKITECYSDLINKNIGSKAIINEVINNVYFDGIVHLFNKKIFLTKLEGK